MERDRKAVPSTGFAKADAVTSASASGGKKRRAANGKNGGFIGGALLLSVSAVICKAVGLLFKLPLIRYVGVGGMSYFTAAYHVFLLFGALTNAGLPVALSVMISRSIGCGTRKNTLRIFRTAFALFVFIGAVGTLVLSLCAEKYSSAIGLPSAASSVRAIAPSLLFAAVASAFCGFFQGHEIMAPSAITQLIQSLGKLAFGVGFAYLALHSGAADDAVAAASVFGVTLGVVVSAVFACLRYVAFVACVPKQGRSGETPPRKDILTSLGAIALPITLGAAITSLTSLADTAFITNGLVGAGYAEDVARAVYGSYTNLAVPLFNLVPAVISPVGTALVPSLTSAVMRKDEEMQKRSADSALRFCIGLALPAAMGMSAFAEPILSIVFSHEAEAVAVAAPLLSLLSISALFCCLITVTNAVLQSYGKQILPILSMLFGAAVKISAEYILLASPVGVFGAPISTFLCSVTVVVSNAVFIARHTPIRVGTRVLWRALAAAAPSVFAATLLHLYLSGRSVAVDFALLLSVALAALSYLVLSFKFGVFSLSDVETLPHGESFANVLVKLKLSKRSYKTKGKVK